tara:strand:- start:7402 stop:8103 length:702 start_codon:yes stop_codon:yes gene_type:complete
MTLADAYDYLDLLLDKADQPYFISSEKDTFLELALTEWINQKLPTIEINESSRIALAPLTDWQGTFSLTDAEIALGDTLADKYDSTTGTDRKGYFLYGGHYVLPSRHLYTLSMKVRYKGSDELVTLKSVGARDTYSSQVNKDPFNKHNKEHPTYSNLENRLVPYGPSDIILMTIMSITTPALVDLFDDASSGINYVWIEHHQKELIQIAARKMAGNIESSNYDTYQKEVESSK